MIKLITGGYTSKIRGEQSISEMRKLMINGINQWIVLRGENKNNPVLFHFHGGPGGSQIGNFTKFLRDLEKEFVVVHWDQRGAGKSYHPQIPKETMTLDQLVEDAKAIVDIITKEFNQEKILLTGQSFGSLLGMLYIYKYPESIKAFIGINQAVTRTEEEKSCYETALKIAKEKNDKKGIEKLEKMGPPERGSYKTSKDLVTQRGLITKYKGVSYKKSTQAIQFPSIFCSELTLKEKLNFMKGFGFSFDTLWEEFATTNLKKHVPEVKVPVYFVVGRHDAIVPIESTRNYYENLIAPKKKFIIFEESGHLACFEEPEKFCQLLLSIKREEI